MHNMGHGGGFLRLPVFVIRLPTTLVRESSSKQFEMDDRLVWCLITMHGAGDELTARADA
jgi:hypothetical protein